MHHKHVVYIVYVDCNNCLSQFDSINGLGQTMRSGNYDTHIIPYFLIDTSLKDNDLSMHFTRFYSSTL